MEMKIYSICSSGEEEEAQEGDPLKNLRQNQLKKPLKSPYNNATMENSSKYLTKGLDAARLVKAREELEFKTAKLAKEREE